MISVWLHLFLLGILCSGVFSAPLDPHPYEETDPELSAGYFEGDIIVDLDRNGVLSKARHWPNATVPYKISDEFEASFAAHIELAMRTIELSSCVRFVPATREKLYLSVIPSATGCNANLGYGKQNVMNLKPVELDKSCFRLGAILHELLHTLGFTHQQNSPDRDKYVRIVKKNIAVGAESNFAKRDASVFGNYNQPYDYGSVLHYGPKRFSINGEPTIVALKPEGQALMGQRVKMSEVDINRLNTMYKCPIPTKN